MIYLKTKKFLLGIFYIILYFILSVTLQLLLFDHINSDNFLLGDLTLLFINLFILFIFIIIFRKTLIPDYTDFLKNGKSYLKNNYQYYLIGLGLMMITNLVIGNIFVNDLPTNESLNRSLLGVFPISSIVSMVITAPIIEELMTRKTFKDAIKNEYLYIFVSGFIFGSLHLLSATSLIECLYVIPYGILGGALAKIYYNTNNIWSNIFFHSLHNFIAIMLIVLGA